MNGRMTDK